LNESTVTTTKRSHRDQEKKKNYQGGKADRAVENESFLTNRIRPWKKKEPRLRNVLEQRGSTQPKPQ